MNTCRLTSSVRIGAPDSCGGGTCVNTASDWSTFKVKDYRLKSYLPPGVHVVVGLGGVHFGEQEASLKTAEEENLSPADHVYRCVYRCIKESLHREMVDDVTLPLC